MGYYVIVRPSRTSSTKRCPLRWTLARLRSLDAKPSCPGLWADRRVPNILIQDRKIEERPSHRRAKNRDEPIPGSFSAFISNTSYDFVNIDLGRWISMSARKWVEEFRKIFVASFRIVSEEGIQSFLRQAFEKIRRREINLLEPMLPSAACGLPVPSDFLLRQIGGPKITPVVYLQTGCTLASQIRQSLNLVGKNLDCFKSVLDWGCGCARVLRWLYQPQRKFYGSDISQEAVDWCKANVPFAKFERNDPLPPLSFPDESFDLIYGISVLTHLDEKFQFAWLTELNRIAKPGAIIILSVHGELFGRLFLPKDEYDRFLRKGFLYKKVVDEGGVDGLPDFYQMTHHSQLYIENYWTKFFRLLLYAEHAALHQDMVVMEKAKQEGNHANQHTKPYVYLSLPIGYIEGPKQNACVDTEELSIRGWAFHPNGGSTALDIFIDKERIGTCFVDEPRSDIIKIYPIYPNAKFCGFSKTLLIRNLSPGGHMLWVSEKNNLIPIACTFFQKSYAR